MKKFGEIINQGVPVMIYFFTEWNDQATESLPPFLEVAEKFKDKIKTIKIDIDENQELADALRIKGLPTVMIYQEGSIKFRTSGPVDQPEICEELRKLLMVATERK